MRGDTSDRVAGTELTALATGALVARARRATSLVEVQRLIIELGALPGVRDAALETGSAGIPVGPSSWGLALRVQADDEAGYHEAIEEIASAARRGLTVPCQSMPADRAMPTDPLARALLASDRAIVVLIHPAAGWTALSEAFDLVLGYDRLAPPEVSPLDLVHPDDHAVAIGSFVDACTGRGSGRPFDLRVRTATGRWRTIEVVVRGFVDDPGIGAVAYLGIDVTDKRERSRPVESSDTFVPTVAHELRGPLSSVVAFAHLLGDPGSGGLTDDQRTYLDVIDRNANRLLHLIEDLLLLSRLEAGTLPLKLAPVRVPALVEAVVTDRAPAADRAEIALSWDLLDGPELVCDEARVQQVLGNLLANAFAFTPVAGRVSVTARPSSSGWQLVVSDTGVGIPATEQSKLFSPFFRASNVAAAGRSLTPGAGLGLMISRAIVELHGGRIEVASTEGVGTTVTVSLPKGGSSS